MQTGGTALALPLTVAELLADPVMKGAQVRAGHTALGRHISAMNVMTVPEIGRWVRRDEFLLTTGYPLPREVEGQLTLLRDLHEVGLSGIGIKLNNYMEELTPEFVATAESLDLPLIVIPPEIRFDDILTHAFSTIVNRQAAALARAQEIHTSFLDISLSGGGLAELARKLASLLNGASVAFLDLSGAVLADSGDTTAMVMAGLMTGDRVPMDLLRDGGLHVDSVGGGRWALREIRAGELHHGFVIVAEAHGSFDEFSLVAVDQAAIVAALEVTRDLAVGAVERRFSSNALFELISGDESEFIESASRGVGFGWNLHRDVVVLVCRRENDPGEDDVAERSSRLVDQRVIDLWASAVRSQDRAAAAAGLGSELLAVIGAERDVLASARAIKAEIEKFARGSYAIGVSRTYAGPKEISTAYQEARAALRLGHRVSGQGSVTAYGDLGLFRLLAQVGDEELRAYADETLGPLLVLNEPERSEMLTTLEALVERNMNMAETARHLHYHYNTLRYRLTKLEKLLGEFSTNAAIAMQISVALQIMQMQRYLVSRSNQS
jgi:purine catabolism regulator